MTVSISSPMAVNPAQVSTGQQQAAPAAPKAKGKGKAFGKDFLPPGIAKKLPPPTPQPTAAPKPQPLVGQPLQQQPVILPGGVTPTTGARISAPINTPISVPIGTPLVQPQSPIGLPPVSALNQAIFNPVAPSPLQLNPQSNTILGSAVPGLIGAPGSLNNSPAILDGVAQAFGSGNPLAGPIQLVNNINANALSTIRAAGLG